MILRTDPDRDVSSLSGAGHEGSVAVGTEQIRQAIETATDYLREHPNDDQPLIDAILGSMQIKPKGHDFDLRRAAPAVVRFMSHTGG